MREKMIELFCNAQQVIHVPYGVGTKEAGRYIFQQMADHLIANGVTIPVRCKDCKHRYVPNSPTAKPFCTAQFLMEANDNDFCSRGERREGE